MVNRHEQLENVTSIESALNQLRNFINPAISSIILKQYNPTVPEHEMDVVYLHMRIMFCDPNTVHNFLQDYRNSHGNYATKMFVNYTLQDTENHVNVTALECAIIWNTDPYMVRLLYQWGANVDTPNITGYYTNENNMPPYRNYLSPYTLNHNNNMNNYPPIHGIRNRNQFHEVIREVNYIAGEDNPPPTWQMPIPY